MNTPKLISILSSPIGSADPSHAGKAADPAHGLDFSRLLGEKRSQSVAPAFTQRPAQSRAIDTRDADRQASTAPAVRQDPVRPRAASADHAPAANDAPQAVQHTATQARHSEPSRDSTSGSPTAQASDPASPASQQAHGATDTDTAGTDTAQEAVRPDTAQAADNTQTVTAAVTTGMEHTSALAEAVAESGLTPVLLAAEPTPTAAASALPTARSTLTTAHSASPHAQPALPVTQAGQTAAQPLQSAATHPAAATTAVAASVTLVQEAGRDAQERSITPLTSAVGSTVGERPALPLDATGLPGLQPHPGYDMAAGQAQRLMAGQAIVGQQAGAAAPSTAQVQVAAAQLLNGVDTVKTNPATEAPAAVSASNARLGADAQASSVQPLPIAAESAGSAAALSLQEFTAMVAAARATAGSAVSSAAGLTTASASPLTPPFMAGLMPAGMLPGQTALAPGAGISAPLSSPQWPTELGRQFIHIAQAGNGLGQVAELRLDPPELGPLRITIKVNDNVAHAVFSSPHALVRQTVENAMPQLQQMLEQAGISLGQANVNDQHQSDQASQDQAADRGLQARATGQAAADSSAAGSASSQGRPLDPNALVDTFA